MVVVVVVVVSSSSSGGDGSSSSSRSATTTTTTTITITNIFFINFTSSGSQKEKHIPERPASKALRHENSEGVWNELAHYKTEYEQLAKER